MKMYRQGDVLLIEVEEEASGAPLERERGRVVLAHGEATGHAHAISESGAFLFPIAKSEDRHLKLVTKAWLRHDEHAPIELPPGNYHVRRQREYSPKEIRRVAD